MVMPELRRALAGEDGGALATAILHQLGHVAALGRAKRGHAPIVEDQDIDSSEPHEHSCVGAVGAGQGELVKGIRPKVTVRLSRCDVSVL